MFLYFLQFSWHALPEREKKRHSNPAEPVYSPTMAGGLFSIDKKFFEKLGTYDSGFDIWGGENLELSFKVGICLTPGIIFSIKADYRPCMLPFSGWTLIPFILWRVPRPQNNWTPRVQLKKQSVRFYSIFFPSKIYLPLNRHRRVIRQKLSLRASLPSSAHFHLRPERSWVDVKISV